MKIGAFAKKYGITLDTIRHYMDIQLLLPEKSGGQYDFDHKCCNDLDDILWFRGLGFSLAEIEKIFFVKRLSNFRVPGDWQFVRKLLEDKKNYLLHKIDDLQQNIEKIEVRIAEMAAKEEMKTNPLGVPIEFIPYLACPTCGTSMILHSGNIENNMIMSGRISCRCGYILHVTNGIITATPEELKNEEYEINTPENYEEFIQKTSAKFINTVYRTMDWMLEKLSLEPLNPKLILEIGTGSGILLKHAYERLNPEGLFIATDTDIERLRGTKWVTEKESPSLRVVFIHGPVEKIPLKPQSVDLVFDYLGTFCHHLFGRAGFLVDSVTDKLKPEGKWIAGHYYYEPGSKSLQKFFPEECRRYLLIENIVKSYANQGYITLDAKEMGSIDETGEYEPYLLKGDRVYVWCYYGMKSSTPSLSGTTRR